MSDCVIKKRGKYLEGHSYSSLTGYSFYWTANPSDARKFKAGADDGALEGCRQLTGGTVISADAELLNKQPGGEDRK